MKLRATVPIGFTAATVEGSEPRTMTAGPIGKGAVYLVRAVRVHVAADETALSDANRRGWMLWMQRMRLGGVDIMLRGLPLAFFAPDASPLEVVAPPLGHLCAGESAEISVSWEWVPMRALWRWRRIWRLPGLRLLARWVYDRRVRRAFKRRGVPPAVDVAAVLLADRVST